MENHTSSPPKKINSFEWNRKAIIDAARPSKEQLLETLHKVYSHLDKEPKLIRIEPCRVIFCGDTHGNINITLHLLKHLFVDSSHTHSQFDKIVFLGDFIDRGLYSVENVNILMYIKSLFPENLILIRGNHETREINSRFEFYEHVVRRYGIDVFELYNKIFSKLPLAVLTWNNIFAVHGGVPEGLEKLSDINGLEDAINPEDKITFQILWNDPVEKDGWFFSNFRGKFSKKFGRAAFEHFIKKHNISLILRAHEIQKNGYKLFFGAKLISIDSTFKKRKKNSMKFFIVEKDGSYRIADVEFFNNYKPQKFFSFP